LNKYIKCNA